MQRGFEEPTSAADEEAAAAKAAEEARAAAEAAREAGEQQHKVHQQRGIGDQLFGEEQVEILEGEILTPRGREATGGSGGEGGGEGGGAGGSRSSTALVPATPPGAGSSAGRGGSAAGAPYGHLPTSPTSLTTERRRLMMLGAHPPELYRVGMTDEERGLRMRLAIPDPAHGELADRLRALDGTFTEMKTEDLLRELPSKPLLATYVARWAHMDLLEADLKAHFRLVRNADGIARVLRQVMGTDLEAGLMTAAADHLRLEQDEVLASLARAEAGAGVKRAATRAEKAMRAASNEDGDGPEQRLADLWTKVGFRCRFGDVWNGPVRPSALEHALTHAFAK